MQIVVVILMTAATVLFAESARAGCCNVRKIDPTLPTVTLRVCAPDAAGACGSLLFAGPLAVGESQAVCSADDTVVYQEAAPGGSFGAFVEAVCVGMDVEI